MWFIFSGGMHALAMGKVGWVGVSDMIPSVKVKVLMVDSQRNCSVEHTVCIIDGRYRSSTDRLEVGYELCENIPQIYFLLEIPYLWA